jgi:GxxExxY protein
MGIALKEAGLSALQQAPVTVRFRGRMVGDSRAGLLLENAVIVELEAAKAIDGAHEAQLLNYLKRQRLKQGC